MVSLLYGTKKNTQTLQTCLKKKNIQKDIGTSQLGCGMKTTTESRVELLNVMGDDLTVVEAARVSFDKSSDWEYYVDQYDALKVKLSEKDEKLINYLAKHNHWTPFAHCQAQFRITAPIFVARQLVKHQVGLVWNEVSRRYVDDEPVFYIPKLRARPDKSIKQGSGGEYKGERPFGVLVDLPFYMEDLLKLSLDLYTDMITKGVAPEQARMVLPQNTMTTWWWTGSLTAFHRVCKLRLDPHAQLETREVAEQIKGLLEPVFPVSWKALNG